MIFDLSGRSFCILAFLSAMKASYAASSTTFLRLLDSVAGVEAVGAAPVLSAPGAAAVTGAAAASGYPEDYFCSIILVLHFSASVATSKFSSPFSVSSVMKLPSRNFVLDVTLSMSL